MNTVPTSQRVISAPQNLLAGGVITQSVWRATVASLPTLSVLLGSTGLALLVHI